MIVFDVISPFVLIYVVMNTNNLFNNTMYNQQRMIKKMGSQSTKLNVKIHTL